MYALRSLARQWTKVASGEPPFFFPRDREVLKEHNVDCVMCGSYRQFTRSKYLLEDEDALFADLLPLPYIGDITRANIFLLQLNPGFGAHDYFGEREVPLVRSVLMRNLKQQLADTPYPFPWLNPAFSWHGGFGYWESRLWRFVKAIQREKNLKTYQAALSYLAKRLAVIELVPYHSRRWRIPPRVVDALPSAQAVVKFVTTEIVTRAKAGSALVITLRGQSYWGVDHMPRKGLISDRGSFNRGAYFIHDSVAERALANWLGIQGKLSENPD